MMMMMNTSPAPEGTDSTHTYLAAEDRATLSLASHLQNIIQRDGDMPFDQWMAQCLYHPEFGYYTTGDQRVGREGDFYTSISVGKCFGMILAHRIMAHATQLPAAAPLELVEIGANSGQLACDILDTLAAEAPLLYQNIRYTICEPLADMRHIQAKRLTTHLEKIRHYSQQSEITPAIPHGILLSNELIDAFPVKRITKIDGAWMEQHVSTTAEGFCLTDKQIECSELLAFTRNLPLDLVDGYKTEFRPQLRDFAAACADCIERGLVITIDYGHIHSDYYSPHRTTGTLRTFHQHTAGEDPLSNIGAQDITAHVDFSQLAKSFADAGLEPSYFDTQSRYLTRHARAWFQSIEDSASPPPAKLIRQFQTLTHPAMMGRQFHVLECHKHGTPDAALTTKLGLY